MIAVARAQGERVAAMTIENPYEGLGVNDRQQLAIVETHAEAE